MWDRNLLFRKRVVKQPYINPHEMELLKVDFEPQKEQKDLKLDGLDGDAEGKLFLYSQSSLFSLIKLEFQSKSLSQY